jgi:hypothetical protein
MGSTDKIMKILHVSNKGLYLDTLERFCISNQAKEGNQINDQPTISNNKIF